VFWISVSSSHLGVYDEPETLSYQMALKSPIGAYVRQNVSEQFARQIGRIEQAIETPTLLVLSF
jgi:hypothetical protein